jgi:ubiquinone/menaquinone biosynthesis C-methylase UbiE
VPVITLGAAVSLHLRASHFTLWWVPAVVLLVLVHGAIVGAVVWMVARLRARHPEPVADAGRPPHGHTHPHEQSHVLHRPRLYDWLVRAHTLGDEGKFRREILQVAALQPGESVLDVGCGTGSLLIEAARSLGSGSRLHGVEPSSEMLVHAQHKAQQHIPEINFVQGSADQIPFPDATFDVVFCTLVLHHLPAAMQLAAVQEMSRVVRPGGRLVIVDMQQPRTIAARLSIVTLFHKFATNATAPDWSRIEGVLAEGGIASPGWHPMWNGAVVAMVARIPAHEKRTTAIVTPVLDER